MPIKRKTYLSITCDGCGTGYDAVDGSAKDEMQALRDNGWTGTYRKCFCPECSKRMDSEEE